jgi:5-methylcytosine-specific restriction endonuclease McrA
MEVIAEQAREPSYAAFLHSRAWRNLKALVLKRAGGLCEACLSKPAVSVHHVDYSAGRLPPAWMLRAVCPACHQRFHVKTIVPDDWKPKNSSGF